MLRVLKNIWFGFCFSACLGLMGGLAPVALGQDDSAEAQDLEDFYKQIDPQNASSAGTAGAGISKKARAHGSLGLSSQGESAFENIAIIQRRFLPKTKRMELSAQGVFNVDQPVFYEMGVGLKLAGFFLEAHGIELNGAYMFPGPRTGVGKAINDIHVAPSGMYKNVWEAGASYKWQPFYGKAAWMDRSILPFDIYLTLGWLMISRKLYKVGQAGDEGSGVALPSSTKYCKRPAANTQGVECNWPVRDHFINFGFGQIFALSKSLAFRWDVTHYRILHQGKRPVEYLATLEPAEQKKAQQQKRFGHGGWRLHAGVSLFFPKARYR